MIRRGPATTLAVACAGVFVVFSSLTAVNTAAPTLAAETGADQEDITWIIDGLTLALASFLLVGGAVGDRFGRRLALQLGLVAFVAVSFVPLVADNPEWLIAVRVVSGLAAAFVLPATLSMITASVPPGQRARGVAIWAVAAVLAGSLGMIVTGLLLEPYGWLSAFLGPAAVGALAVVAAPVATESRDLDPPPFDGVGAALSVAGVALVVVGVLEGPVRGWTDPWVLLAFAAGAVAVAAFSVWESRVAHPILDVRLFGRPRFATGAVSVTAQYFVVYAMFFVVAQQLQTVLGHSALVTGLLIGTIGLTLIPTALVAGPLARRLGMRILTVAGMALLIAGSAVLARLEPGDGLPPIVCAVLLMGAGLGLATPIATLAIVDDVADEKQGVASAVNDLTREVGAALGIALSGSVLAAEYGRRVAAEVSGLPADAAAAVGDSVQGAAAVAGTLGSAGASLLEAARAAFTLGVAEGFTAVAGVLAAATAVLVLMSPGRDGRTLAGALRRRDTDRPSRRPGKVGA